MKTLLLLPVLHKRYQIAATGKWFSIFLFSIFYLGLFQAVMPQSQMESVTVRFANPQVDFMNGTMKVDVEFQCDVPNQRLFGKNVRFFYDPLQLNFLYFTDYAPGYGPITPNPPYVATGLPQSGLILFSFPDRATFVNGAIQLLDNSAPPVYISTTGWTKLYSIMFEIVNANTVSGQFCPVLIWDLQEDPSSGGFLWGSDGVVITLVAQPPMESKPSEEHVIQYNWQYSGTPGFPYGYPVYANCFSSSGILIANNDDFLSVPVNGCYGNPSVGNVLNNDLLNGNPVNASQVILQLLDNGGLNGAQLLGDGSLSIPAGSSAGYFTLTYSVCEAAFPQNCATAQIFVHVTEEVAICPGNIIICQSDLPLTLSGAIPEGGIYSGNYVYFDPGSNKYLFHPPVCGEYPITYTYHINSICEVSCQFSVIVLEVPIIQIIGSESVIAGSKTFYQVSLQTNCLNPQNVQINWSLSGGGTFIGSSTGYQVQIQWDNSISQVNLTASATVVEVPTCNFSSTDLTITKNRPTLAGQIKYWNCSESLMPSPFVPYQNSPYPLDYFYVTLCKQINATQSVELSTVKVEPTQISATQILESSFKFEIPVEIHGLQGYFLKVWDGGQAHLLGTDPPAQPGTMLRNTYTFNEFGGVTSTDALAILVMAAGNDLRNTYGFYWVGPLQTTPRYGFHSHSVGDVNNSNPYVNGGITAVDATLVNRRAAGVLPKYPSVQPGQAFSPNFRVSGRMVSQLPATTWPNPFLVSNSGDIRFVHSGASYMENLPATQHKYTSGILPLQAGNNYINIYYNALGDIDASYIPPSPEFKSNDIPVQLSYDRIQKVRVGEIVPVEIRSGIICELGAITLKLKYDPRVIEILNVDEDIFTVDALNGLITMCWFDMIPRSFNENETITSLLVKVKSELPENYSLFTILTGSEFADPSAKVIEMKLKADLLTTVSSGNDPFDITIYPNPTRGIVTLHYELPDDGHVQIELYSTSGQKVKELLNDYRQAGRFSILEHQIGVLPGTYLVKITMEVSGKTYVQFKPLMVIR